MKTKIKPKIMGLFSDPEEVFNSFGASIKDRKGVTILFAWYEYEDYSGVAFVLFRQNRKLYEVYGSHCSCYGLEGQWQPEQCYMKELKLRAERNSNEKIYYKELNEFLKKNFKRRGKKK